MAALLGLLQLGLAAPAGAAPLLRHPPGPPPPGPDAPPNSVCIKWVRWMMPPQDPSSLPPELIGPPNHIIWAGDQCMPPGADCSNPASGAWVQQSPCIVSGGFAGHWDVAGMKGGGARGTCHTATAGGSPDSASPSGYVATVRDDNFVWTPTGAGESIPPETVFTAKDKVLIKTYPNVSLASDGRGPTSGQPHDHCWHLGCILPRVPAMIV